MTDELVSVIMPPSEGQKTSACIIPLTRVPCVGECLRTADDRLWRVRLVTHCPGSVDYRAEVWVVPVLNENELISDEVLVFVGAHDEPHEGAQP